MATTQINGGTQIRANTVTSGQVDSSVIVAGGGNAFTADQSMGNHKLTNVAAPASSTDAATKGYVDGVAAGLSTKASVSAATTGSESFTISSGNVTQISGTSLDGISVQVGDRILIKNAPASTGTGTADSSGSGTAQPGNGIYTVTSNTTNLAVSRASDLSGSNTPVGAFVLIEQGTANKGAGYVVISPNADSGAFTYGSSNIQWTKFSSAASGVSTVSVTSANGFAGSVANPSTTPAITVSTTVTGMVKGNGTALSAATASTDYMAPSGFVTRETPSGSINGSNTTFTLANTPLSGTEQVFLNGLLLDPGAGNDYTISSATITMLTAPVSGDKLRVNYMK